MRNVLIVMDILAMVLSIIGFFQPTEIWSVLTWVGIALLLTVEVIMFIRNKKSDIKGR